MALTITQIQANELLSENSFESVTREWFSKFMADRNESHKTRVLRRFEKDIFSWIGSQEPYRNSISN